jgi:O-antigen ligase
MLAFYVSLVLSSLYAVIQGSDWGFLLIRWTTFLAMFCFYFLVCYVIRTRADLDLFCVALLISGLIASISAHYSEGVGGYWNPIRKSGVGFGHNHAAGNILMTLPMVYALAITRRSFLAKGLLWAGAIGLVFGFLLTLSRSGFLAVIAMGALFLLRSRRIPDPRFVVGIAVLAAFAVLAAPEGYVDRIKTLVPFSADSRYQSRSAYEHHSFSGRLDVYRASVVGFATHPLLGVGTERYLDWVSSYDRKLAGGFTIHNAVLSVACQQGLLGLIPYLALLILTYRDFSRAQRLAQSRRDLDDPELRALQLRAQMAQLGYVGILVVAQFQPGTFWRGVWCMFAFSTIILSLTRERLAQLEAEDPATRAGDSSTPLSGSLPQHAGAYTGSCP